MKGLHDPRFECGLTVNGSFALCFNDGIFDCGPCFISHDVYEWCFRKQNTWIKLKARCKKKISFSTIACASILFGETLSSRSTHVQIC